MTSLSLQLRSLYSILVVRLYPGPPVYTYAFWGGAAVARGMGGRPSWEP